MTYAEIDTSTDPPSIKVATAWNEKELIQQVPGSGYRGAWRVPLTWAACMQLRGIFQDRLILGDDLRKWAWEKRCEYVNPANASRVALRPDDPMGPDDKLFPFQRAAVDWKLIVGSGLLGDEMGCGKTIEVIGYLESLFINAYPVLIICPNSLKSHWSDRINEWIPYAETFVVDGPARAKSEVLEAAAESDFPVVIINFESLRSFSRLAPFGNIRLRKCQDCDKYNGDDINARSCEVHPKVLNRFGFKSVIIDEAHRIKDPHSQQTRAAWAICHGPTVQHRWALTGTPIANHIGDLWSIMHAVAPDEYPTKSKFTARYAIEEWNSFGGLDTGSMNPLTAEEFRSFFNPRFRRMTKDLVLNQLPPRMPPVVRFVEMTRPQAKMYAELESSLMCRTETGELLVAASNLAAQVRLSQLACSSVNIVKEDPNDLATWKVTLKEPSPKIDELIAVIEELGDRQAVVAAEFSQLIDLACERLTKEGIPNLKITGDVSPYDRQRALAALNAGHIKVLLFTTKAGGVGLDMSAASCLIWLQHPWSMVEYLQANDRIYRIGSERHARIDTIHIVTRDTIEIDKTRRLTEKLARLEEINQDRARRIAQGLDTYEMDRAAEALSTAFLGTA